MLDCIAPINNVHVYDIMECVELEVVTKLLFTCMQEEALKGECVGLTQRQLWSIFLVCY